MRPARLRNRVGIGVDKMGDLADRSGDPNILRLENLDKQRSINRAAEHRLVER